MPRWSEIETAAPELVALARQFLDANGHKTLASLRRDGAPRISGTEIVFADGDVWLGSMPGAVKARDLQRDGRFAIHSASAPPDVWQGDAKFAGRVEEITDPAVRSGVLGGGPEHSSAHLFRCDVTELSVVRLNEQRTHLIIESWHPDRGVTRLERK